MDKTVIIIGAGPAGITAAIQLRRAGVDFAIFEKGEVGGLILNANLIENYPGLERPLRGVAFAGRLKRQCASLGIEIVHEEIEGVDISDGMFVSSPRKRGSNVAGVIRSKYLIVASGTRPLKIEGIARDVGYEASELFGVTNKRIAVIGGGDAAFDYALNLAERGNGVSIFFRRERPTCLPLLNERAMANGNIHICAGREFKDDGFDHLLVAIGREPNVDFLPKSWLKTPPSNLYLAGDVCRGKLRQLVIAEGDGMLAAQDIIAKENVAA